MCRRRDGILHSMTGVGVKLEMSQNVYSTRKVTTQVMTIGQICENVDPNMTTGILAEKCDGR